MLSGIAKRVVAWQRVFGRHQLPWQNNPSPYEVWVSEIMLQQTQVKTVIGYYQRFMRVCPDVTSLANLPEDELMRLWEGLGYYARARHLHRAAKMIVEEHSGHFPSTQPELEALPGVGRSTAAAILSLAYQKPAAILDGNVKRVLSRLHGVSDDLSKAKNLKHMWALAQSHITDEDPRAYTQGLMDLGASVCSKREPNCDACPLSNSCIALETNQVANIPFKTKQVKVKSVDLYLLFIIKGDQLGFIKRPDKGIWAKLYTPLIFDDYESLAAKYPVHSMLRSYTHQLTHMKMHIQPYVYHGQSHDVTHWDMLSKLSLPVPTGIKKALDQLTNFSN